MQIINSPSADQMATGWIYAYLWLVRDPFCSSELGRPGCLCVCMIYRCVYMSVKFELMYFFISFFYILIKLTLLYSRELFSPLQLNL